MNEQERGFRLTMTRIGFVMIAFVVLFYGFNSTIPGICNDFAPFMSPEAAEILFSLVYGLFYLLSFVIPAFILRIISRGSYRPMLLKPKLSENALFYIFAGTAITFAFAYINYLFISAFGMGNSSGTDIEGTFNPYNIVLEIITTALIPGFCEEFLFRGAILSNLKPYGKAPAVIISALFFSLMHQNFGQYLYTFAAGLVLGIIAVETESLYCCMLVHFLNNSVSVAESVISANVKNEMISAILHYGIELIIFTAGIASVIVLIIRYYKKKKNNSDFSDGVFGRTLSFSDESTLAVIPKKAVKIFFSPSVIIFIALSVVAAIVTRYL